jgi:hypothetical protein
MHADVRKQNRVNRMSFASASNGNPGRPRAGPQPAGYIMDPFFNCHTREDHVQVLLREHKCLLEDDDVMRALRTMTIAQIKAVYWAVFKVLSAPFEMKTSN